MRVALTIVLGIGAAAALATEHPQEAKRLSISDGGGRSALTWVTTLPAPMLPAASPVTTGARLRVGATSGETAWFELPASGWTARQGGGTVRYVFTNRGAPNGPSTVKMALLKDERTLRVAAKGSGLTLNESSQGTVTVHFVIGGDVYCSECASPSRDRAGRYVAKHCPAPATCELCGDGVVEAGEQCDGTDLSNCQPIPAGGFPITLACEAAGSPGACGCCITGSCLVYPGGGDSGCCGDGVCMITTPVGMVRGGQCVPRECTAPSDCTGGECAGGLCCAGLGESCLSRTCCSSTGAECTYVNDSVYCCQPPGTSCIDGSFCCSQSCTAGTCD